MPRRVRASLSQRAAVLRLMGRGALYHHARPCSLLCKTAPNGGAASQSMEPLTPTAHRQRARLRTSFVVQRNSSTRQLVLLDAQHLKSYWLAEGTCVRKSDQSVGRSTCSQGLLPANVLRRALLADGELIGWHRCGRSWTTGFAPSTKIKSNLELKVELNSNSKIEYLPQQSTANTADATKYTLNARSFSFHRHPPLRSRIPMGSISCSPKSVSGST